MDDAGGAGQEDGVSGGKYFGADAAFAERGTWSLAGAEKEKSIGRDAPDEYTGTSVGVPVEGIVASEERRAKSDEKKQLPRCAGDEGVGNQVKRRNDEYEGGDGV